MHIIINRNTLLEAIPLILRAVSGRSTLKILECVLFTADSEGLRLVSSDLEVFVRTSYLNAQVIEPGSIALEARTISEILRRLPDVDIEIKTEVGTITTIAYGRSEIRLVGMDPSDFPNLPRVNENSPVKLSAATFKEMVRQTVFAVSVDETKPVMRGELVTVENGTLKLTAVDGFRIAIRQAAIEDTSLNMRVIIPGKALNEVSRVIDREEFITLNIDDKNVMFILDTCEIYTRLLNGDFIKFDNIITDEYTSLVHVNCRELLESIERAQLIARENKRSPVKLSASPDRLVVSCQTDTGTLRDEIIIDLDGQPIDISFNPRYLIDALRAIEVPNIRLQMNTSLSPCIIKSDENSGFLYLLLPVRML